MQDGPPVYEKLPGMRTGLSFCHRWWNEDVAFHSVTEESGIAAYAALTDRLRHSVL